MTGATRSAPIGAAVLAWCALFSGCNRILGIERLQRASGPDAAVRAGAASDAAISSKRAANADKTADAGLGLHRDMDAAQASETVHAGSPETPSGGGGTGGVVGAAGSADASRAGTSLDTNDDAGAADRAH